VTHIRRRFTGAHTLQVESRADSDASWKPVGHLVALGYESPYTPGWELRHAIGYGGRPRTPVLPFQPLSVRHFYDSEQAILEAAYTHMKRLAPPVMSAWEGFLANAREVLPVLPAGRSDELQVAYRFNNPLAVVPTESPLSIPAGARGLEYEPRLGFVIGRELRDATPEEARAAIAAFVLICEFNGNDGSEPRTGAVPGLATPPSSIAAVAVSANVLLDTWPQLTGTLTINGSVVAETSAVSARTDLGELLAAASVSQRLLPGELFSIEALAPATPSEPLVPGDHMVVYVPGLGRIEHAVS
jgi:2-keto-4-pentenoate hydratase/2-oxohepta-3-ene-1,7-dioic acid hydratase in catechol pathway